MRRYFKNLLSALLGNNPYEAELDDLRRQMEQASENVERLRDMYCAACEKWESAKRLLSINRERIEKRDSQIASLQQLVENLRERIADKDAVIDQLQHHLP